MAKVPMSISERLPLPSRNKRIEPESEFLIRIAQECRRAERSSKHFVLVLIHDLKAFSMKSSGIFEALAKVTREIDMTGWYETDSTMGILFVELGNAKAESARETLLVRIKEALENARVGEPPLAISAHILPRDVNKPVPSGEDGIDRIYEYLEPLLTTDKKVQLAIKRAIDLVGATCLLVLTSPLLAAATILVKCSSPGPAIFRQTRVGQGGKHFTFLKFRSMKAANDPAVHEKYAKEFIHGKAEKHVNDKGEAVFKLTRDSRVTPVGRFLRKTSLDELPQLWNVLRGEMSLVGPRPPIPYEVECYGLWHQRRVLELKPGITGLWQVKGRSRIGFDDMVRLDLQYARTWSPWLDLKILLMTPRAVIGDGGAR